MHRRCGGLRSRREDNNATRHRGERPSDLRNFSAREMDFVSAMGVATRGTKRKNC